MISWVSIHSMLVERQVFTIVGKSVMYSTDRKLTQRKSTEANIQNLPQNSAEYH